MTCPVYFPFRYASSNKRQWIIRKTPFLGHEFALFFCVCNSPSTTGAAARMFEGGVGHMYCRYGRASRTTQQKHDTNPSPTRQKEASPMTRKFPTPRPRSWRWGKRWPTAWPPPGAQPPCHGPGRGLVGDGLKKTGRWRRGGCLPHPMPGGGRRSLDPGGDCHGNRSPGRGSGAEQEYRGRGRRVIR